MQVLQDKWKSFRANRKLQGLWNDFQQVKNESMSERKEQRLNQFLECLNNIAEDQILQDLQEEKKNPNPSKQMSLGVKRNVISGIFQDIPQVINAIMEYLDENGFNVYGSKVQQASQDSLKNQRRIVEEENDDSSSPEK